jgi:hypothetical protein
MKPLTFIIVVSAIGLTACLVLLFFNCNGGGW